MRDDSSLRRGSGAVNRSRSAPRNPLETRSPASRTTLTGLSLGLRRFAPWFAGPAIKGREGLLLPLEHRSLLLRQILQLAGEYQSEPPLVVSRPDDDDALTRRVANAAPFDRRHSMNRLRGTMASDTSCDVEKVLKKMPRSSPR